MVFFIRKRTILCLLSVLVIIKAQDESEDYIRLSSELELINWDLQDECNDYAQITKDYLLGKPNGLANKIKMEVTHGSFLRKQSKRLEPYENTAPYELERNLTFFRKPGDSMLPAEDYQDLIEFANNNIDLANNLKISCFENNSNESCYLHKQEYLNELSSSKNLTHLQSLWSRWQNNFKINEAEYVENIKLIHKAATLNGDYDAKTYWEMLSDVDEAYSKSEEIWQEIEPIYKILHDFVLERLNAYYNTSFETIPVYLLGSNFGDDWSNLAEIILPHPQVYHDVKAEITTMNNKDFYKFADNFTKSLGLNGLNKYFWKKSIFNQSDCKVKILNYCNKKYSTISTCNKPSFQNYLSSHETAVRVNIDEREYTLLSQRNLRGSAVIEAVVSLGSLYGLNNLMYYDLLPENTYTEEENGLNNKLSMLLMAALKILPKLAYYHAADTWRLQELEYPSENLTKSWWELREKIQGVSGVNNLEPDYLGDEFIVYNKPYISKFMGLVLQFQILNYYQINFFQENSNLAKAFNADPNFVEMIDNLMSRKVVDTISYFYALDLSAYPLIEFFSPLEDYLLNAPKEQAKFKINPPRRKTSIPTTSAATTTTTTTTTKTPTLNDQEVNVVETRLHVIKNATIEEEVADVDNNKIVLKDVNHAGTYVGAAIAAGTILSLVGLIIWKKMKKRPVVSNRRFET